MLTIVIIDVIVIVAVAVLVVGRGRIRAGGTKAAEWELGKRVRQHGSLTEQPLSPEVRARYTAQWAGISGTRCAYVERVRATRTLR